MMMWVISSTQLNILQKNMANKITTAKKISVVVPVYRSEDCVEALVKSIEECLADFEHEIVLVNDYSPDNSWLKIKLVAQTNKNVIGINFRKNSGQDNAIMAGLAGVS